MPHLSLYRSSKPATAIISAFLLVALSPTCESFGIIQQHEVHRVMKTTTQSSSTCNRSRPAFTKVRPQPSRNTNHQRCFMSTVSSTSTSSSSFRLEPKPELQPTPQTMKFVATKRVKTEPISIPNVNVDTTSAAPSTNSLIELLNEFFSNESNRNLLFPNNNAESLSSNEHGKLQQQQFISHEFVEKWTTEAQLGGGEGPTVVQVQVDDDDTINIHRPQTSFQQPLYKLVNEPTPTIVNNGRNNNHYQVEERQAIFKIDARLQMPGLQIISESTIGMKLLLPSPSSSSSSLENQFPEYQFTLLEFNLKPKGRAPVVWLFNKLTKYRDSTSSFTKVRVETVTPDQIMFVTDAKMETRMHLPSKLLKVLPNVNIEKFESQGSASVQRLLEKELGPALNGFGQAFYDFIQNKNEG